MGEAFVMESNSCSKEGPDTFFHTLWLLMELLSDLNVWKSRWGMLFLMEDSLAATQLSLPGNRSKHMLEI